MYLATGIAMWYTTCVSLVKHWFWFLRGPCWILSGAVLPVVFLMCRQCFPSPSSCISVFSAAATPGQANGHSSVLHMDGYLCLPTEQSKTSCCSTSQLMAEACFKLSKLILCILCTAIWKAEGLPSSSSKASSNQSSSTCRC